MCECVRFLYEYDVRVNFVGITKQKVKSYKQKPPKSNARNYSILLFTCLVDETNDFPLSAQWMRMYTLLFNYTVPALSRDDLSIRLFVEWFVYITLAFTEMSLMGMDSTKKTNMMNISP